MTVFSRPIPLLLVTVCGCLLAMLARQLIRPDGPLVLPTVASRIGVPDVPAVPRFESPPAELLVEISGRPIFSPARKPFDPEAEARDAPPPAPQITFVGTITEAGQLVAMVKITGAPASTIKAGAVIAGWQVTDIAPQRILLSAKSSTFEVKLNQVTTAPIRTAQANSRRNPTTRARRSSAPAIAPLPQPAAPPTTPPPNPNVHFRGVQLP